MPLHNLLNCKGFIEGTHGFFTFGSACMKARLGLVFLFFIIAIIRKWGGEEMGLDFNFMFSLIGGLGAYLVLITIFGNLTLSLLVGLGAGVVLGYGSGYFFGGDGE